MIKYQLNRQNVDSPFPRKLTVVLLFLQYKLGTARPIHAFRLNLPNNKSHGPGSKGQDLLNFSINQLSVTVISKSHEKMNQNNIKLQYSTYVKRKSQHPERSKFQVPGLPNVRVSWNICYSSLEFQGHRKIKSGVFLTG